MSARTDPDGRRAVEAIPGRYVILRPVTHRPVVKNADKYCRVCGRNFVWNEADRRFYWDCHCDPTLE